MYNRPSFNEYFMGFAKQASTRSNCLRAHVGAVIVDKNNRIRSTGYNGTPSKVESCMERGACYRMNNNIPSGTMYETCRSLHAEQNAIIQAGISECKGSTMYIYGHSYMCIMCKRFVLQSGIERVFIKLNDESKVISVLVSEIREELSEVY